MSTIFVIATPGLSDLGLKELVKSLNLYSDGSYCCITPGKWLFWKLAWKKLFYNKIAVVVVRDVSNGKSPVWVEIIESGYHNRTMVSEYYSSGYVNSINQAIKKYQTL